jgi:hypothetical protein
MATRVFLCPNTGDRVQDWFADNGSDSEIYEAVTCLACRQVHMVNPKTGYWAPMKRPTTRCVT